MSVGKGGKASRMLEHSERMRVSGRGTEPALHNRGFLGPSLEERVEHAQHKQGRRVEEYIGPEDNRLRQAAVTTLAHSLAQNSRRKYEDNVKFFFQL